MLRRFQILVLKRWPVVFLPTAMFVAGCTYERVVYDGWDRMREMGERSDGGSAGEGDVNRAASIRRDGGGDREAETAEDPLNLRRHFGKYSLQIGFYDDAFGNDFRQAAEMAARQLRKGGDPAFYYHGPHRSMVTIGLFTDDDFDRSGTEWSYGPQIKTLQEKYPNNLGNGLTLIEKINGEQVGAQPSFLVRVY